MRLLILLFALLTTAYADINLNWNHAAFDDPFWITNDPVKPDVILGITVETTCPSEVTISVPIVGDGVNTPQFFATVNSPFANGPVDFSQLPYISSVDIAASPATITFIPKDNTNTAWLVFTNFKPSSVVPALDANGHAIPGFWTFTVEIPTFDFQTAGLTVQGGDPNNQQIVISSANYQANSFIATQPSERCGGGPTCPPGGCGDPVFSGFQGQSYQFHGLPDEHFNLVSSPDVSVNSHFVYLSSGKCDYNDTECFTHPGTYMDVLGYSIGETHIKFVAGTHDNGLRVWVNDLELQRGANLRQLSQNVTASLRYHHNGRVEIRTEVMSFEIVNSDMFFNIRAGLNDQQLLRVGHKKHTVTDKTICKTNSETHNHQLVEQTVAAKYPVNTPLHGLIGQTWRNVKVCGKDWMGTVQDYLVSDLFANDNHYNYFKW